MYQAMKHKFALIVIICFFIESNQNQNFEIDDPVYANHFITRRILASIDENSKQFTLKLCKLFYKNFQHEENVLFSPFAIIHSLAAVEFGTIGPTSTEIRTALGFYHIDYPLNEIHDSFMYLTDYVIKPTQGVVKLLNGIYMPEEGIINQKFMHDIETNFAGFSIQLPFSKAPIEATEAINAIVSNITEGRIEKLFTRAMERDTKIILAPILYFNSLWLVNFVKRNIQYGTFHTKAGPKQVFMMTNTAYAGYINFTSINAECLYLWLEGKLTTMTILLPYVNTTLENVIESLEDEDIFAEINTSIKRKVVKYQIPRMKMKWSNDIEKEIQSFGITKMFNYTSDFGNMIYNIPMKVSKFFHAAYLVIDGNGVGSGVPLERKTKLNKQDSNEIEEESIETKEEKEGWEASTPVINFTVDRPFMFIVNKLGANSMFFTGIVNNPDSY